MEQSNHHITKISNCFPFPIKKISNSYTGTVSKVKQKRLSGNSRPFAPFQRTPFFSLIKSLITTFFSISVPLSCISRWILYHCTTWKSLYLSLYHFHAPNSLLIPQIYWFFKAQSNSKKKERKKEKSTNNFLCKRQKELKIVYPFIEVFPDCFSAGSHFFLCIA